MGRNGYWEPEDTVHLRAARVGQVPGARSWLSCPVCHTLVQGTSTYTIVNCRCGITLQERRLPRGPIWRRIRHVEMGWRRA
jgi:hypothetical protein